MQTSRTVSINQKMSILLPLYVYPSAGAWDPLYAAAKAYRDVDFRVILNPCSGPCMGSLPDQVYLDEIPKLHSHPNIHTLGYVATNYTDKPLESVLAEIDTYASWPTVTNSSNMRVEGIFLDETPSSYDPDAYAYLETAGRAIRNSSVFADRFVVHNPGLISPTLLSSPTVLQNSFLNLTDLTIIYEETFNNWLDKGVSGPLQANKLRRKNLAVLLHSLPDVTDEVLDFVVQQVENAADWVFLTNSTDNYYHDFSPMFDSLVKAVNAG
ncbi:Spherulation-specific family 4 [Pyrenophora seminiperda CCB06]|uniref:Spherulation-specific family 4 n=1 Tax=Pyrenophora seminiperda CCB06 TaxID=1302712 RepID=A0A3M7LX43_9PLEO|nr:Spherulation-specific family 4 [Pyrenophora seminiperda CCB06]